MPSPLRPLPTAFHPALDLLRVCAFSMVAMVHTPSLQRLGEPFESYLEAGFLGVELFMVISGWLIGGLLVDERLRHGHLELGRFFARRWIRTLPPYFVMLALVWVSFGRGWGGTDLRDFLLHTVFAHVYAGVNAYGVSWSLAAEEHFYLAAPLLVVAAVRLGSLRGVVVGAVLVQAASFALRHLDFHGQPMEPYVTHLRLDGLAAGLALALASRLRPDLWDAWGRHAGKLAAIGIALLAVVGRHLHPGYFHYVWSTGLATWGFALVVFACVHAASPLARVRFPGLRYLGELTFPLYLTHTVLPRAWIDVASPYGFQAALAWKMLLVVVSAMALQHLVIGPSMTLRERLVPRRSRRSPCPIETVSAATAPPA